ncbi:hypothetical protein DFH06DRAFT_174122 [Mycena polygramma]|nr:hypothetical protein DFH06DRAFT_174122 [Mycena polygramma]
MSVAGGLPALQRLAVFYCPLLEVLSLLWPFTYRRHSFVTGTTNPFNSRPTVHSSDGKLDLIGLLCTAVNFRGVLDRSPSTLFRLQETSHAARCRTVCKRLRKSAPQSDYPVLHSALTRGVQIKDTAIARSRTYR